MHSACFFAVLLHPEAFAKFDISAAHMISRSYGAIMEHIGDISASVRPLNYIRTPGLHRTLIGDGIATSLADLWRPANTTAKTPVCCFNAGV